MAKMCETVEIEENVLYNAAEIFSFGPVKSIGLLLFDLLKEYESKVALIDSVTGKQITYRQLLSDSVETAKCFVAAGLKFGDTIGIVCENRLEFPVSLIAALFIGVAVAPINPTYTEHELVHAFEFSRPKWILTSPLPSENVRKAASQTNITEKIIQFGNTLLSENTILFQDFINQYKEPYPTEFSPVAVNLKEHNGLVLCSSGTTGLAKGVQMTHFGLLATFGIFGEIIPERKPNVGELNNLGLLPFSHAFGSLTLLGVLVYGGKTIVVPKFDEQLFLSSIEEYKITMLFTVPTLMQFLAKNPIVDNYNLSNIQEIRCSAAPLRKEIVNSVVSRLNSDVKIMQFYGMTETPVVIRQKNDEVRKPGCVGTLAPSTYCKVVDPETGKILGKNQAGQLYFKGPQVMKGYIGNDKMTNDTIDKDGWINTGDVGYYDDDYHFYIVDRLKELIKYKGFQVPPAELESILLTNPKIKDAAVVGLPDDVCGELPLAFVVAQPNVKLTEEEVIKYVEAYVSSAKRLRGGVRFLDEIPKNTNGKILRRVLRDLVTKAT